jgi:NAD(P)-dependent dehydrogenase (short-subunit alcohol dehydrogenase family)
MSSTRSVVVTGCGTGIGRAIFNQLLDDGWAVVGLEIQEALADDARAQAGARGDVVVGDVAQRENLEAAAERAGQFAPLRGWVNNAALALMSNLHEPNVANIERVFEVNLMGYFWGCSAAIRRFLAHRLGGAILNVSSIHGTHAFAGWAAYDMAKGGVDALTRYIAVEYGPVGIRANAIAPGAILTPLAEQVAAASPDPSVMIDAYSQMHALERPGKPEEVAAVAAFLLADSASFMSGQVVAVDGGAIARCFRFAPDPGFVGKYRPFQ